MDFSVMGLIFLFGLRHGFDPDHLAAIDGLIYRYQSKSTSKNNQSILPLSGFLFALGHGLVVTMIAFLAQQSTVVVNLDESFFRFLHWLPVGLLVILGVSNARQLLVQRRTYRQNRHQVSQPSWLSKIVQRFDSPWSAFLVGILFAMVFDTASQVAAWSYSLTKSTLLDGALAAVMIGSFFTIGMMTTTLLDSFMTATLLKKDQYHLWFNYRQIMGWVIVFCCFAVAIHSLYDKLDLNYEPSELLYTLAGVSMLSIVAVAFVISAFFRQQHRK